MGGATVPECERRAMKVRISTERHARLRHIAARDKRSIRELVEAAIDAAFPSRSAPATRK